MAGEHAGHRQRMRERFLTGGLESFADHEVLELMLFYAIPQRNVNPLAHRLLDRFGTLHAVLEAPVEELMKVATAEWRKSTPCGFCRACGRNTFTPFASMAGCS